jgi:hypothetical protein
MHRIKTPKELALQRGYSYRDSSEIQFPPEMDEVCGKLVEFGSVSRRAYIYGTRPWTIVRWMAAPVNEVR